MHPLHMGTGLPCPERQKVRSTFTGARPAVSLLALAQCHERSENVIDGCAKLTDVPVLQPRCIEDPLLRGDPAKGERHGRCHDYSRLVVFADLEQIGALL